MYSVFRKAQLTWAELEEILLNIETIHNSSPLTYIEEESNYPILITISLILGRDVNFPEAAPHECKSETMKKRLSISNDVKKLYGKDGT